ncbi:hypothetical protein NP233_g5781 [Leucocoprinus birnbaumii]|uniref:Uncharacterized protein n=1 Tax=Leucocoprinus birnbaumii TaxID=56174 RepID=A0AAD5VYC5_9AGAR|nr:hypothetical protein NP233_g5781 [Leucocoprinus birnbaumii]
MYSFDSVVGSSSSSTLYVTLYMTLLCTYALGLSPLTEAPTSSTIEGLPLQGWLTKNHSIETLRASMALSFRGDNHGPRSLYLLITRSSSGVPQDITQTQRVPRDTRRYHPP